MDSGQSDIVARKRWPKVARKRWPKVATISKVHCISIKITPVWPVYYSGRDVSMFLCDFHCGEKYLIEKFKRQDLTMYHMNVF